MSAHAAAAVRSFLMSVMAVFLSGRPSNAQYSFGYHRAEVIGALASIMVVWVMTGVLVYEAVLRLIKPVKRRTPRTPRTAPPPALH